MPAPKPVTRAIKFRLVVPRGKHDDGSALALWTTHEEVNKAVRYYQEILLTMRQQAFEPRGDEPVSDEQAISRADRMLDAAWDDQSVPRAKRQYDAARDILRQLYHVIQDGNAQKSGNLLSPLVDPNSRAFVDLPSIVSNLPSWLDLPDDEKSDAAAAWVASGGHERLKPKTRPPTWYKKLDADDPSWLNAFCKWAKDRRQELEEGQGKVIIALRELKLVPLFTPYLAPKLGRSRGLTPWDRLAFKLAVAQLLSWQAWTQKVAETYTQRKQALAEQLAAYQDQRATAVFDALRGYEATRSAYLSTINPDLGEAPPQVQLTKRTIRGWRSVREAWLAALDDQESTLIAILADKQTSLRGRFGDPDFFAWLAKPAQHWLWSTRERDERDLISAFAITNQMAALVDRSRETAFLTYADALKSPRSSQWEYKGGSHIETWQIQQSQAGLVASLPVLAPGDGPDQLKEIDLQLKIAPTDQIKIRDFYEIKEKKYGIQFHWGDDLAKAALGSADLLLDWRWLRNKRETEVAAGKIGPAYLKVALEVEPIWDQRSRPFPQGSQFHFLTARGKTSKRAKDIMPGYRVLSVDLGVRHLASCSVFELRDHKPAPGKIGFHVEDRGLWAHHERSFTLKLQDEALDRDRRAWQTQEADTLRRLRAALGRYRRLRDLATRDQAERLQALEDLLESAFTFGYEHEVSLIQSLRPHVGSVPAIWHDAVADVLREWRQIFGKIVETWRKERRSKDSRKHYGKSMWAIQHLTDTHRFLKSWSLLGESSGQIRRWNNEQQGVFGQHLLDHLDGIKDDRIKSGADLLVQAARGFVQTASAGWRKRHEPCDCILFEDLSRYRTRLDRPKAENSQLSQWAHRGFLGETKMQAELYGIDIADLDASYTSRFRAKDGAPGHRLTALSKATLENPTHVEWIERDNPGIKVNKLTPGMLVLDRGGGLLGSLTDGRLTTIQADINASHALHKRFWTRFGHQQILRSLRKIVLDDRVLWLPTRFGERLKGTMAGYGYLQQTGDDSGAAEWVKCTLNEYKQLRGGAAPEQTLNEDEDQELARLAEDLGDISRTSEISNFFRDESGEVLPSNRWYPAKIFWRQVKNQIDAHLKKQWS